MPTPTPLKFLSPAWFSLVMGTGGLALAWHAATPLLGAWATGAALVIGAVAALLFGVLVLASLWRWHRFPAALEEDLTHPVRHGFVATLPISLMLLASVLVQFQLALPLARGLWWAGSLLQLWVTLWVLGRWLGPGSGTGNTSAWAGITPVLLMPVVGNVMAPLGGVGLGHGMWATAQFGVGAFFWPVVLVLIVTRRFSHGPLPERLLPTYFVLLAPPALIASGLMALGAPLPVVHAVWGVGLFTLMWVGAQAKRMIGQPFALTFWAVSFPLAALTALTLKLGDAQRAGALLNLGVLLLATTSLVVLGLVLTTYRGLRNGTLLAPEPLATIVPVNASL
jgi:tellurite resistance protein